MNYKVFKDIIVVRLDKGEEIISSIKELCKKKSITAGTISGLGAADFVVIGLYNVKEMAYYSTTYEDYFEITSLTGNISVKDDEPYLHINGTFANIDSICIGGRVNEARISSTCEIVIQRIDGVIGRSLDENTGLNVIRF